MYLWYGSVTVLSWFASGAFKVRSWCVQGSLIVRSRCGRGLASVRSSFGGSVRFGLVMRYGPPVVGYMRMRNKVRA